MRISTTRHALFLVLAIVAASLTLAGPAGAEATPASCTPLLHATPSVEADIDGDGSPDARVPSFRDVRLCVQSDVIVYDQPSLLDTRHCAEWLSCVAFYVTVGFNGYADTGIALCYSVDGWPACVEYDPGPVPVNAGPRTICIGYDMAGGSPCGNDQYLTLE